MVEKKGGACGIIWGDINEIIFLINSMFFSDPLGVSSGCITEGENLEHLARIFELDEYGFFTRTVV
ncbi:MAG TPA: hypothetical protein PK957_04850 [Candidatus Dojkabacteria bacterium]|nr:hypothetical protein [Candidatus Dojkabacteria bacterium]